MEYREFMEQIKKDLPERLSGTLEGATVDTTQVDRLQGCSYEMCIRDSHCPALPSRSSQVL